MSRATRQQLTLLSAVSGALAVMQAPGTVSIVARKRFIEDTRNKVDEVIMEWDGGNNPKQERKDIKAVTDNLHSWGDFIDSKGVEQKNIPFATLACMCVRILCDMYDVLKNKRKMEMIDSLIPMAEQIHTYADRTGMNTVAFSNSDEYLDFLYDLVDWDYDLAGTTIKVEEM